MLNHQTSRGFSLIELLVAMLIIVLMSSIVLLSFEPGSDRQSGARLVDRIKTGLEQAGNTAITEGRPMGLVLHQTSANAMVELRWYQYHSQRWWYTEDLLPAMAIDPATRIQLKVEGYEVDPYDAERNAEEVQAALVFYPTGEMTPFDLQLLTEEGSYRIELGSEGVLQSMEG